ncbi:poly(R)-hydroxyalkanoic acid synthase subunit [Halostella sp. JP-L12]|uniref:poly(R)-hydroxyalkanoic acid synthase subunit n=1 Tax=Halostella TaxID=1843185 RepID=UPI000EF7F439|nr:MULTISPECIES: poly(R)-hydroxyalkanoic acid synthase subunit [Halostella]NHN48901.1 poly(R)-hydroxyalkanoic acid synthase subunit [Halostella sp. JP-L12]
MADSFNPDDAAQNWNSFVEQMNKQFMDAFEQNVEAQAEFVESWTETLEANADDQELTEGVKGYARAYEAWMDAAQQMVERVNDSMEGEDVEVEEFRDIWLNTANEAFKEAMSTTAFAAATGESVQQALDLRQQAGEASESTLSELGFATEGQIVEVGERLVELERRQHAVEQKLDRIVEELEE